MDSSSILFREAGGPWVGCRLLEIDQDDLLFLSPDLPRCAGPFRLEAPGLALPRGLRLEADLVDFTPKGRSGYKLRVRLCNMKRTRGRWIYFMGNRALGTILRAMPADLAVDTAARPDELKDAFRLVYREYRKKEFCRENALEMHFSSHCLLPGSRTFLLRGKPGLLGTVTLIADSPCGLPLESAVPQAAGRLRAKGKKIAEVSLLSVDREKAAKVIGRFSNMAGSFMLFKAMLDDARMNGRTDLLIMVNPAHELLYRNLGFQPLEEIAAYGLAAGQPGRVMHLDIGELQRTLPQDSFFRMYFFEEKTEFQPAQRAHGWNPELIGELLMKTRTSWQGLLKGAVEYLKRRYPEISRAASSNRL